MKFIALALLLAFSLRAEPVDVDAILDSPAKPLTSEKASLATLFYSIGRTYGLNLAVDPGITQTTLLRFNGGTVRQLIHTLLESNDLFMEPREGVLFIKKTKTEFYFLEYPQIARSASSSTSVSLSPGQNGVSSGFTGIGGAAALPTAAQPNLTGANGGTVGTTSFSISEKSDDSFWASIETDLKSQKTSEEKISVNRFSGIVTVEATLRRHQFWSHYLKLLNERINSQVIVEVRIDKIVLNEAHKLGVDLTQLRTSIGQAVTVGPVTTATDITDLGGAALPGNTLLGNFATGKLSAVLTALQEQGELMTLTKPTLRLLNNQKGFVKVGEDRTFYSLFSNVSINQPGLAAAQTTTQNIYQGQQQTFGVVLPVTAQIGRDGWVTLILEPARTQLDGIDRSPDNTQTAPETGDERVSTMLRLRDGESAVLGGLNSETDTKDARSVPFLSRIPGLGAFFQTNARNRATSELLVTVSVQIVR